jgi:integrase
MGTVFKKTTTRADAPGAEVVERRGRRVARWKAANGRTRTAALTVGRDGSDRIATESATYFAKYRDGGGVVQVVPTGCRDETAARQVLADLERQAELMRAGVVSAAESAVGRHRRLPLANHIADYVASLEAAGCCPEHRRERHRQLTRLAAECQFNTLADLDRSALERWLADRARAGMGARTRNSYLTAAVAFCNWCCAPGNHRLAANPFARVPKANERADPWRQRRAMDAAELVRLLAVAQERPLLEALTVRRGARKGQRYARVRPETRDRLTRLGRERALIYKTLVLTGLRKKELASLTVAQLSLDDEPAFATLDAADEKSREGNVLPQRSDLAADLREWLADKLRALQEDGRRLGEPIPARLPPDAPIFTVPDKLCKILTRDLRLAGIPKRDERGRVLDVHAMRHTFGTLMSKGGVAPRTTQAAMRHARIELTMKVYTDPKLLDVHGALDALPDLPLDATHTGAAAAARTGTDAGAVAPTVAPTPDSSGRFGAVPDNGASILQLVTQPGPLAATGVAVNASGPLTSAVNGPWGVGATGLEPVTPSVSRFPSAVPREHKNPEIHRHFRRFRAICKCS